MKLCESSIVLQKTQVDLRKLSDHFCEERYSAHAFYNVLRWSSRGS